MNIKSRHITILTIIAGCWLPVDARTAEFEYEHVLPMVKSLTFLDDAVVIRTSSKRGVPVLGNDATFVVDREHLVAKSIPLLEADELTDEQVSVRTNVPIFHDTRSRTTSEGTAYTVRDVSCSLRTGAPTSTISFDSRDIEIQMNSCSSFAAMESTDAYLWIGTYHEGSHDDYGAEGLLVIDRDTGRVAAIVDTGPHSIGSVVRDPETDEIWAITANQITIASVDLRHQKSMQFYHDFNVETGAPELRLAVGRHYSHPLAVVAGQLPREHWSDFYRQVKIIPDEKVRSFRLYDFFMCCSYTSPHAEPLPREFNVLTPFVRIGIMHTPETMPGRPALWRQLACRLDDPDAKQLCSDERAVN